MIMKQYSIRQRLVVGILISMLFILGGMGFWSQLVAEHESEEIFSARLATSARVLESLVARQLEKATITNPIIINLPKELEEADGAGEETGHPYESRIAFQVWRNDGTLLAKSASAPNETLGSLKPGFTKHLLDDELWHVFTLTSGQVSVLAAEKNAVREEMASDLGVAILTPLVAGALLLLIVVNTIAFTNLRPLQALADLLSKRKPQSIEAIELHETPNELKPVIHELNHLLQRVRDNFTREQRFIDAAAHEIRTPIAALQIHIQNAVNANNDQDRSKSLEEALKGLRRTTRLAEQLLTFSRMSGSVDKEKVTLLSLDAICEDVIHAQSPLIHQRGQTIKFHSSGDYVIQGEQSKIERLLQNLIDNASHYGTQNGVIDVALNESNQFIELSVTNDGATIPDAEKEKIFNAYYRVLGNQATGSGLGLAIVKEIVNQHQASITVENKSFGNGTKVTVRFKTIDTSEST
ncbi:sensor histidine kinase N-terminal domain-containing protein [Polynucleobacter sp. 30F-ANTBAC]|jgi:two-component system sensor histidine kinase QseC|nr:sensor histidine kinase N-terminal domain-containing protein [Polynucleobacter sp. 30F-ANTBAC]